MKKQLLSGVLFLCLGSSVVATDARLFDFSNLRKQAMGGVFASTALNNSALVENPAGMYYAKGFEMPRVGLEYNDDFSAKNDELNNLMDVYDKNQDGAEFGSGEIVDGIGAYNDLVPFEGYAKLNSSLFSFAWKGFGIGLYTATFLEAELPGGLNSITTWTDVVPSLAYAREFNIWGPTVVGVSAKYLTRGIAYDQNTGDETITLTDAQMIQIINGREDVIDVDAYTLSGLGIDVGFLRPVEIKSVDTLVGLSFKNVATSLSGTKELNTSGSESVDRTVPMLGTIGISMTEKLFSWVPYVGRFTHNTTLATDYNFISPYDSFGMNFHAGIEQEIFGKFLKLRAGINQGFIVGGVGLDVKIAKIPVLHFDYANYTEELGDNLGNNSISYQAFRLGILF